MIICTLQSYVNKVDDGVIFSHDFLPERNVLLIFAALLWQVRHEME